jgi:hypothetical protein
MVTQVLKHFNLQKMGQGSSSNKDEMPVKKEEEKTPSFIEVMQQKAEEAKKKNNAEIGL